MEGKYQKGEHLPPIIKQRILRDYLSGQKTSNKLAKEHGVSANMILKMVSRYKKSKPTVLLELLPVIPERTKKVLIDDVTLRQENEILRKQLKLARLKLKAFQILGDILDEQYGIDLLKKAVTKESHYINHDFYL